MKKMNESGNSVKKIVPEGRVWKESSRTWFQLPADYTLQVIRTSCDPWATALSATFSLSL